DAAKRFLISGFNLLYRSEHCDRLCTATLPSGEFPSRQASSRINCVWKAIPGELHTEVQQCWYAEIGWRRGRISLAAGSSYLERACWRCTIFEARDAPVIDCSPI